ncbi:MAG: hypothetical protein EPO62_02520 [Candidatus Nitrosotenuis sp.]|nr:MAG: hypothetical protein EPO62_02520 [Candidatus Nitrosotenuis sp.]
MQTYKIICNILCFSIIAILYPAYGEQSDSDNTTIAVESQRLDKKTIDGMWVEIKSGESTTYTGFTPASYNATKGVAYTVHVSDYENYIFEHWGDGDKNYFKAVNPSDNVTLVAYFYDKSANLTQDTHENPVKQSIFPDWVKNAARQWIEDKMSDSDFLAALQQLVDQKILSAPIVNEQPRAEGFGNTQCNRGFNHVEMIGRYTNGDTPYQIISLRLLLLDDKGEILATGSGMISNVGPHETKYFNAIARYHSDFTSCEIQVESKIAK